jgi:DNA-binding Xre family transcriptional regulator
MNAKERKQEEKELEQAVGVLRSTLRSIAHRKARRYEQEFLCRVRDMID